MTAGTVVDADSHILEPAELWLEYMEPEFKSRAMRINRDEKGLEYLDINGVVSTGYSGGLGSMAAVGKSLEWKAENTTKPYSEQRQLTPAAIDPAWSKNSCSFLIAVFEQHAGAFTGRQRACDLDTTFDFVSAERLWAM